MKFDKKTFEKLTALLAHKKTFETALTKYLDGISDSDTAVIGAYSDAEIKTPYVAVSFEAGAAEEKTTHTALTGWQEDYIFSGSLTLQYCSRRAESPRAHFERVAQVRAALCAGFAMDTDNLPLSPLVLTEITFAGENYSYDENVKADITELYWDVKYLIAPSEFDGAAE